MPMTAGQLRQAVLEELKTLGFEWQDGELHLPEEQTKPLSRELHEVSKHLELERRQDW